MTDTPDMETLHNNVVSAACAWSGAAHALDHLGRAATARDRDREADHRQRILDAVDTYLRQITVMQQDIVTRQETTP